MDLKFKKYRLFILLASAVGITACEKDEIPVDPYPRGEAETASLFMGTYYSDQVWYSLENNTEAGRNKITDWDIAVEGSADGSQIYLNGARMMTAWLSPHSDIFTAFDTVGFGTSKKAEIAREFYDSPALGDWKEFPNSIYLVDLGYSELGTAMGLVWIQIISVDDIKYEIRARFHAGTEVTTHEITKSPDHHLVHYSILEGRIAEAAPADHDWDLIFTKYTYQFVDPPMAYLVTGALLNPNNTRAAVITDKDFENITAADTLTYPLSSKPDIIGYNWKTYSFDLGQYTVDSEKTYIIHTQSGFLYKIRFVDFYGETGVVGTPMFEKIVI